VAVAVLCDGEVDGPRAGVASGELGLGLWTALRPLADH
jgi:hypothetical protein